MIPQCAFETSSIWRWENGRTILATVIIHLNSINVGMCQGYSAVLLPQLEDSARSDGFGESFAVSAEEASWIASLGVLLNPLGALMSGVLMDTLGRKTTLCYTTIPFLFGWLIIAMSDDVYTLCVGRCISGVAIGMASSCYVYVAEISVPRSRGVLSSFGPIFVSFGVVAVYSLGYLCAWKFVALVCAGMAVASFAAIHFIPESPSWLAVNATIPEASRSLAWFRASLDGCPSNSDAELQEILQTVKMSQFKPAFHQLLRQCFQPQVWKPFVILIMFFAFQELSGIYIVLYYAVDFFKKTGASIDDYVASILVACLRFIFAILGSFCIQTYRRKVLAATSGILMAVPMALAAAYEATYQVAPLANRPHNWIPLVCVLANVSASMLGMLQLPWLMMGELFPLAVRGMMGGVVSSLAYLCIFATVKFYPNFLALFDTDGTMWLFCVASLGGAVYACFFLPETKDKSLSEIQSGFANKGNDKEMLRKSQDDIPTISVNVRM